MARYDDGKRGYGVTDTIGLSVAWQQIETMLFSGALQFPTPQAPPLMLDFFKATYPPEQWEIALHSELQMEEAERRVVGAVKTGQLPLWVAPKDGPISERLVAGSSLVEFGRESLTAGCYIPFNGDAANLVCGYPLFIKLSDWTTFLSVLATVSNSVANGDIAVSRSTVMVRAPSLKAGRPPNDDEILAKADEMKARGLDGRTIASKMRHEPDFENVATTYVRELIKGRWKSPGRPKKKSA